MMPTTFSIVDFGVLPATRDCKRMFPEQGVDQRRMLSPKLEEGELSRVDNEGLNINSFWKIKGRRRMN